MDMPAQVDISVLFKAGTDLTRVEDPVARERVVREEDHEAPSRPLLFDSNEWCLTEAVVAFHWPSAL